MTIRRDQQDEPVTPPWPNMPEFEPSLSPEQVRLIRSLPAEKQADAQAAAEIQSLGDQRFLWLLRQSDISRKSQIEHELWHIDEQKKNGQTKSMLEKTVLWLLQLALTSLAAAVALKWLHT